MFMKKLPVKAQASLRIGTVSPGPRIKAYTKRGSICRPDQNDIASFYRIDGYACF